LTDIKVLRDIGGTGKKLLEFYKMSKMESWSANGKPVRVLYSLPITIQTAD
jgi:protein TonB